jgi:hypothetical protein
MPQSTTRIFHTTIAQIEFNQRESKRLLDACHQAFSDYQFAQQHNYNPIDISLLYEECNSCLRAYDEFNNA